MKILLFGAGGLLGRHLQREFSAHELTALTHAEADITCADPLDRLFARPWDAVINAAAICHFDACESDPVGTGHVNREAPLDLARRCARNGARFVQFSSDYVFPGHGDRPLTEDDTVGPLSVYGRDKAALERAVPEICSHSLVIRLSWLYGADGKTFMSQLPRLLAREKTLRVAAGKRGRCLYAPDAARWVRRLLEGGHAGLFNLVNDGDTSWEEFARTCWHRMQAMGWAPACREIIEVPYTQMGRDWDKRPVYSCLDVGKLARVCPPGPRHWTGALEDFLGSQKSFADHRSMEKLPPLPNP